MNPPIQIVPQFMNAIEKKRKIFPCHINRASELGHPCLRYLYYCRMNWQDRELPSPGLQLIFDAGNELEGFTLRQLEDAGFNIFERQRPFEWKEYQITGHVDGMIQADNKTYPLEIKHLNQFTFAKINTIQDFLEADKIWLQKYPTQLALYMLMSNSEWGCLLIRNKQDFTLKEIWFSLDDILEIGEQALKRAEAVNKAIETNTEPERIAFNEACTQCPFFIKCLPDQKREGGIVSMDNNPELIADLIQLESLESDVKPLKPIESEIKKLKKKIQAKVEGQENILAGDFAITGKIIQKKGYEVRPSEYWAWKYQRLGIEKEE